MITKEELQKVKEQRRTNLYYAEKEYLQYIFLHALSKYSDAFVFKGGTCLRICYVLKKNMKEINDLKLDFRDLCTMEIKNQQIHLK